MFTQRLIMKNDIFCVCKLDIKSSFLLPHSGLYH